MKSYHIFVTMVWIFIEFGLMAGMIELNSMEYYVIGAMSMVGMYVWWTIEMEGI